ncbi:hypothetical protein ACLOJK_008489 [Asimina triloba]
MASSSALQEIEKYRQGAEIAHDSAICKAKTKELLTELGLPIGLLPLGNGVTEVGYNRAAGFVWMLRRSSHQHFFKKTGRWSKWGTVVTAYVEKYKMSKITGVTSKQMMVWATIKEMAIDDPQRKTITFKGAAGVKVSFPVSAFEEEEEEMSTEAPAGGEKEEGGRSGAVAEEKVVA